MKILSVRFQNLNSLKGEHEIRFDQSPLAEAGLFAITGATGAGKTTVLDAITVGLYGLVHRHSSERPLELMTRHTAESFSEVAFEAGGKRYRSKWHIRRSRGKVDGNIQPVHMELFCFEQDEIFDLRPSEVPAKVAELCGLDYNQFLRSVMLSQGDFARFLKANPNERSSLLEKITDTGIYSDISKFAYDKARTERQKREDLEQKLQNVQLLPEEQRQAYESNISELAGQEARLATEIKQLQEMGQWLQLIAQLQARQAQQKAALQVQEQKLEQLKPEFAKLQQHEQAHQFVGELAEIRSAGGRVKEAQEQLQTLRKHLPLIETELEAAGRVATEATKLHQQQEVALQQLEPLLTQVTRLDHQLHSIRESYKTNKAAYVTFQEQLTQEQNQQQAKKQDLDKLKQEATEIKSWLEKNARLQDLKENLPELRATLRDLQEAEQRIKAMLQEQQALQQQRQQEGKQLSELRQSQTRQQALQEQYQQQKEAKLAQLQSLLADKSMPELEHTANAQPAVAAKYERLQGLAVQHAGHQQKSQGIHLLLQQQEQQRVSANQQLQEAQTKYGQAQAHLEALDKLVRLQQQIQQYEEARHTLHQGDPCPLCGSKEHPYITDSTAINLPEEVQRRDKQLHLVKEYEQRVQSLQVELHTLHQKHELLTASKAEADAEVKRLCQAYEELLVGLPHQVEINATAQLATLLAAQQESADALQQQLAQARALSRELESINQQLQQLREASVLAQAKQQQLQASDELLQKQLQKLQVSHADEQQQQQAHVETAQSFAASFGLVYAPEKRLELQQTLEQLAQDYSQKQKALQDMREQYTATREQVKHLDERVQERQAELAARQQALKEEHELLVKLKTERQDLFGEKDPEQERQLAQREVRAYATQAEEARTRQRQKQQELQEVQKRQTECHAAHRQSKSVLDALCEGLLRVLQQKGIETIEALSQMLLERDEADRLANLKAQTEKHLTELRKSLSDVSQELKQVQAKQLTHQSPEALEHQQQEKTTQQRELISQRARCQQLLEQDAQQREKNRAIAAQLQTQQQVHLRWSQLSDLIGSADGNKFSRFAQGLTLARLVELANRHLQKLNDRYRILKSSAEDLELLIVDTYQAEAVRPMNTLSGGESFLVSLALALGLSDLAGRRTQINSLFIDEGFGTLDSETLDAAISTLENLQASGKMIGIISHVEALKERISTQIKVQRQAGGVSKISVVC